jgi:hypothetical protein
MAQQIEQISRRPVAPRVPTGIEPKPRKPVSIDQFVLNKAVIAIKHELGQGGLGQEMVGDLGKKFNEFKDETRQHMLWLGLVAQYFVPFVVFDVTYEHIYAPDAINESFAAFVQSCLFPNSGHDEDLDFAQCDRIKLIPPDTQMLRDKPQQWRDTSLKDYIVFEPDEQQYYLVFSTNLRHLLIDRLCKESVLEDPLYNFVCWSAAELRAWLLKIARVLIRYPDIPTPDPERPDVPNFVFPDCSVWRNYILANGVAEETPDPSFRLTMRYIFEDNRTSIDPLVC